MLDHCEHTQEKIKKVFGINTQYQEKHLIHGSKPISNEDKVVVC